MSFNPVASYSQGFQLGNQQRMVKTEEEEKRLRGLAIKGGEQSEAYKKLLAQNPMEAKKLSNAFKTDAKGLDALVDDSMSLLYHLESDPSGQAAMGVIDDRLSNMGGAWGKDPSHTQNLKKILMEQGPEALKANLNNVHGVMAGIKGGGKGGPKLGTYNPSDYTVDSWTEFTKGGDPSMLQRYESESKEKGLQIREAAQLLKEEKHQLSVDKAEMEKAKKEIAAANRKERHRPR